LPASLPFGVKAFHTAALAVVAAGITAIALVAPNVPALRARAVQASGALRCQ
jgi:hypothetical protein